LLGAAAAIVEALLKVGRAALKPHGGSRKLTPVLTLPIDVGQSASARAFVPKYVAVAISRTGDQEVRMSMLKVIEVLAESNKSWEDAAQEAVTNASKTVRNVKSIWIDNFEATVKDGKMKNYRINAKVSFVLD
jgi:flavin-binding protein dodecin